MSDYKRLINGVMIINVNSNKDNRGYSFKPFSLETIAKFKVDDFQVKEVLFSLSQKDVIRGMHFQMNPRESRKIITLIMGNVTDVLIDLRVGSNTFGIINQIDLDESFRKVILVPCGVAHGYKVNSESALMAYLIDENYSVSDDITINPLTIDYDWNVDKPIISKRDIDGISFKDFIKLIEVEDTKF